jgi:hypothetical protein
MLIIVMLKAKKLVIVLKYYIRVNRLFATFI